MSHSFRAESFPDWQGGEADLLTWDDLDVVIALLAEIAPGWSAELNQASPDESTIVVLPAGANDLIGPAFVLHRARGHVHLDQFRWDEYRKLGGFRCLADALAVLRARLTSLVTNLDVDWGAGRRQAGGHRS
jgi:hypothetical protein